MLAPLLYMLALGGIGAAVMFSGYSQVLRSNAEMTSINAVRQQLGSASQTLSASSTLTSGNTILTPPNVTAFAAVTDTARLPSGYATVNATGTPTAYGVLDTATGARQLDPWGKYYLYCKWDSAIATGTNPSIAVISAGPDGTLQSKCGDNAAVGDDRINKLSVAEAINRANVWQVNSSSQVQFGNTAGAVKVDSSGSMNADSMAVGSGATATSGNVYATGNVRGATMTSAGSLTAGSISTGGALSAGATSLSSLSLTSALSIANGGTGATTAGAARTNLGATVTGAALFTTASAGAARTTLGSTATGDALFTTASAADARATLGSTATGDALFTTASAAAARTTLGLGTMATQNANAVAITGGTISGVAITGSTMSGAATVAGSNGQVQFNSSGALGADSAFNWDNTNKRLGIGTAAPIYKLEVKDGYIAATGVSAGLILGGRDGSVGYQWYSNLGNAALWDNANSVARISVDGTGNVGIGTDSPQYKLEVRGSAVGSSIRGTIYNTDNTSASSHSALLVQAGGASAGNPFVNFRLAGVVTPGSNWIMGIDNSDADKFKISGILGFGTGNDFLTIDPTGNVGIGTTTPSRKLDVNGTLALTGSDAPYTTAGWGRGIEISDARAIMWKKTGGTYSWMVGKTSAPEGLYFGRSAAEDNSAPPIYDLVINNSGNVGIGTTPGAKLDVRQTADTPAVYATTAGLNYAVYGVAGNASYGGVIGVSQNLGSYGILGHANAYGITATTNAIGGYGGHISAPAGYGLSVYGAPDRFGLYASNAAIGVHLAYLGYSVYTSGGRVYLPGILNSSGGYYACWYYELYYASSCAYSDIRLKQDVRTIDGALDSIILLRGVSFDWRDQKRRTNDGRQIGLIAQDVERVFPEAVTTEKKNGLKSVNYDSLIGPIVEAIKTLLERILGQDKEIASLKAEVSTLNHVMTKMSHEIAALRQSLQPARPASP